MPQLRSLIALQHDEHFNTDDNKAATKVCRRVQIGSKVQNICNRMRGLFIFMMYGANTGNPQYISSFAGPIFIYNNRLVSGFTFKTGNDT